MSAGPTRRDVDPVATSKRWIPFWVLQAAELGVAFVFVDVAVELGSSGSLVAGAALLAVLALVARGPLGIVRLCPRGLHVVLVVVASVTIALSPILAFLRPDVAGIIVVEFGAVGLIRLATLTRTTERDPVRSEALVPTEAAHDSVIERSARCAAAAAVLGRRALEQYGPAAEDQARRALRGAGRSVGRMRRRASPPTPPPG